MRGVLIQRENPGYSIPLHAVPDGYAAIGNEGHNGDAVEVARQQDGWNLVITDTCRSGWVPDDAIVITEDAPEDDQPAGMWMLYLAVAMLMLFGDDRSE